MDWLIVVPACQVSNNYYFVGLGELVDSRGVTPSRESSLCLQWQLLKNVHLCHKHSQISVFFVFCFVLKGHLLCSFANFDEVSLQQNWIFKSCSVPGL